MSSRLHLLAVVVLAAFLSWVLYLVRYHRLSLRDSLGWILSTGAALVASVFPEVLGAIARVLGIALPVNALFAVTFVYVLFNLLGLTVGYSMQAAHLRRVVQECAILRAEVEDLRRRLDAIT